MLPILTIKQIFLEISDKFPNGSNNRRKKHEHENEKKCMHIEQDKQLEEELQYTTASI